MRIESDGRHSYGRITALDRTMWKISPSLWNLRTEQKTTWMRPGARLYMPVGYSRIGDFLPQGTGRLEDFEWMYTFYSYYILKGYSGFCEENSESGKMKNRETIEVTTAVVQLRDGGLEPEHPSTTVSLIACCIFPEFRHVFSLCFFVGHLS